MDINNVLGEITKGNSPMPPYAEEGDYYGLDGLLHCGKCDEPREMIFDVLDQRHRVRIPCRCEEAEQAEASEEQQRKERYEKASEMRTAGFHDQKLRGWTFDVDDGSNARLSKVAHRYVETFEERKREGKGLLLYGPVGTGKTFMSACIANALIEKGYPCMVTNFRRIISDLEKHRFSGQRECLDKLNEYALIVIDDMGTESYTQREADMIFNIVDARSRSGKPVIVTTNLSAEELTNPSEVTRKRIYSRLLEMCYPVKVEGQDRRRANARSGYQELKSQLEPAT